MLYYVKVKYTIDKMCQMRLHTINNTDYGFVQAKNEDRVREIVSDYYNSIPGMKQVDIYVFIADKDSVGEVTSFVFVDK